MTPTHSQNRLLRTLMFVATCLLSSTSMVGAQSVDSDGSGSAAEDVWAGVEEMVVSGSTAGGLLEDVARSNSVTAFDAEDLEAIGAADISDIAKFTPNLEIVVAGSTSPTFFIRGIGLNDFNANAAGAVAIYQDDVPLNSPALQLGSLYDIEGANVLRGPQGTGAFRNASAGAIKIYSRKPTGEFGVSFKSEFGNYRSRDFEGSMQFPITSETLWGRIAFRATQREGTFKNRCHGAPPLDQRPIQQGGLFPPPADFCGEDIRTGRISNVDVNAPKWINSRNNWAARAVFLIQPDLRGDVDMDWLLTVRGSRRDEPSFVGQSIGIGGVQRFTDEFGNQLRPDINGLLGGVDVGGFVDPDIKKAQDFAFALLQSRCQPTCTSAQNTKARNDSFRRVAADLGRDLDSNPFLGNISHVGGTTNDTVGMALKGTIEIGDLMELTSVTGVDHWQRRVDIDLDFSPNTLFEIDTGDEGLQVYQELHLTGQAFEGLDDIFGGPLDWEVGTFVLYEDLDVNVKLDFGDGGAITGAPKQRIYGQKILSLAGYMALSWDFWEAFTLDGGIRFNWERRDIDYNLIKQNGIDRSDIEILGQEPTGTVRLTYRPTEDSSMYMKFTHGFKTGTFNATGSIKLGVTSARPEKIDAFEIGLRGSYFENRLNLTLSLFHYAYQNYQLFTSQTFARSAPQFVIINASDVELFGSEIEATVLPWEGGLLDVKFAWLQGEFLDFVDIQQREKTIPPVRVSVPVTADLSGNRLLNAPKYSITLTLGQSLPIGRFGTISARWDGTWKHTTYFDASQGRGIPNGDGDVFLPKYTIGQRPYWIHNIRLAYTTPDESIEIALWGRNITNETYKAFSADLSNIQKTTLHFVGDPRTYGVTTSIKF
ncbi:MAG TPA: TonB-dependent receptor [Deltaproteobacteria bacterium]|nr:TonB-dependent receptor [Deltaproteobacteria bacterium]